jgi:ribosomal protein L19E
MAAKQQNRKPKKAKSPKGAKPIKVPSGWNTTDEEEIGRRRLRAESDPMQVVNLDPEIPYFSAYIVQSSSGQPYTVEIRSLTKRINSCSCADYDVNGLGTCKHIEKVLLTLAEKGTRKFAAASRTGSAKAEIYVDPVDNQVKLAWGHNPTENTEGSHLLEDFFCTDGRLIADAKTTIPVIMRLMESAPEKISQRIRLSNRLQRSLDDLQGSAQKEEARDHFLRDAVAGKYALDIVKLPLYDYQKQGMLHLAFLEKAILADEMGLGKSVQAIAAVELLRKLRGIRKVLVVAPTSLKSEWEEQISKFVSHPSILVYGNKDERLRHYQKDAVFYLTNYEQVVRDREDIQRLIAPDVIILDEAQRIKNWRTKTATTIKQLQSPYAFVLTGTPLENRIDDIYSIVQFLDPKIFGSLFRFNREFYQLDEYGKPTGYKNLNILHERLKPVLLRRLKRDVEDQLPNRTVNTYFVPMSLEQSARYEEYEMIVANISGKARKRPLLEAEFKRLQIALGSMRMLCDTPYILDPDCRVCPKLQELDNILEELFQDQTTKIIVFSEWERMLVLVQELLAKKGIAYAWHTGSVNQIKRREEINRFKDDSDCKVFLSTDSGAVGLNLQVANVVVNLDLPWNPAKLEQRIARAWRKHQTRTVQVINFVSEGTIEHRMLGVLNLKKRLADSVLDTGEFSEMEMPSGRKAFMEQLRKILGSSDFSDQVPSDAADDMPKAQEDPLLRFQQEVMARFKPRLHHLKVYKDSEGNQTIFAVVDGDLDHPNQQMRKLLNDIDPDGSLQLEVLDRASFEAIQRLCKVGVLSFNQDKETSLYQSQVTVASQHEEQQKRLREAQSYRTSMERKERMTSLLIEGGFYEEAWLPLGEVFELSLKSFATLMGQAIDENGIPLDVIQDDLVAKKDLPHEAINLAAQLRNGFGSSDPEKITQTFNAVSLICRFIDHAMCKMSLDFAA